MLRSVCIQRLSVCVFECDSQRLRTTAFSVRVMLVFPIVYVQQLSVCILCLWLPTFTYNDFQCVFCVCGCDFRCLRTTAFSVHFVFVIPHVYVQRFPVCILCLWMWFPVSTYNDFQCAFCVCECNSQRLRTMVFSVHFMFVNVIPNVYIQRFSACILCLWMWFPTFTNNDFQCAFCVCECDSQRLHTTVFGVHFMFVIPSA